MIVVFGSINIDLVFRTRTLPREGETVLTDGMAWVPGGKGANQAAAAASSAAGATVAMIGCVGRDPFATPALEGLRRVGVDLSGVRTSDRPTGCAAIGVDAEGRAVLVWWRSSSTVVKEIRRILSNQFR